jgi:hypothetical protein
MVLATLTLIALGCLAPQLWADTPKLSATLNPGFTISDQATLDGFKLGTTYEVHVVGSIQVNGCFFDAFYEACGTAAPTQANGIVQGDPSNRATGEGLFRYVRDLPPYSTSHDYTFELEWNADATQRWFWAYPAGRAAQGTKYTGSFQLTFTPQNAAQHVAVKFSLSGRLNHPGQRDQGLQASSISGSGSGRAIAQSDWDDQDLYNRQLGLKTPKGRIIQDEDYAGFGTRMVFRVVHATVIRHRSETSSGERITRAALLALQVVSSSDHHCRATTASGDARPAKLVISDHDSGSDEIHLTVGGCPGNDNTYDIGSTAVSVLIKLKPGKAR